MELWQLCDPADKTKLMAPPLQVTSALTFGRLPSSTWSTVRNRLSSPMSVNSLTVDSTLSLCHPWADARLRRPAHNCGQRCFVVLVRRKSRQPTSYIILRRHRQVDLARDDFNEERARPRLSSAAAAVWHGHLLCSASSLSCHPFRITGQPKSQNIATSCWSSPTFSSSMLTYPPKW